MVVNSNSTYLFEVHQNLVELISSVSKIMYWCIRGVYVDNLGCLGFLIQLTTHSKGKTTSKEPVGNT